MVRKLQERKKPEYGIKIKKVYGNLYICIDHLLIIQMEHDIYKFRNNLNFSKYI